MYSSFPNALYDVLFVMTMTFQLSDWLLCVWEKYALCLIYQMNTIRRMNFNMETRTTSLNVVFICHSTIYYRKLKEGARAFACPSFRCIERFRHSAGWRRASGGDASRPAMNSSLSTSQNDSMYRYHLVRSFMLHVILWSANSCYLDLSVSLLERQIISGEIPDVKLQRTIELY